MSGRRVVVLGSGRVGSLIARDLAATPGVRVVACDRDEAALARLGDERVGRRVADLADPHAVGRAVADADVVVGAVPGAVGFAVLEAVVTAGRPIVDIAFAPEDALALDAVARRNGVCAVVDCGVAPGMSNWFAGRSVAELDRVRAVDIVVGGLPARRVWPFEYRAVFSPADVIEEYVRPARIRESGEDRVVPALSGLERIDLPRVGTVEAFYTDGLRTLLRTIDAPTLRERTLRWPGHARRVEMLRAMGLFDPEPRRVGDVTVAPRAVTEALLVDAWRLEPGDEEFTVLEVRVEGERAGAAERHVWSLFDRTDRGTGDTSMARTTGLPCAAVVRLVLDGAWSRPGVSPPEELGADAALTERVLGELRGRGIEIERTVESLG